MELRLLNYFLIVCEELHFTRAAERIGISQPTLSHQIRLLEDQLGTVLFHRNGRSIEITDSGHILLDHVNRIVYEVDKAKTMINELNNLKHGTLQIGCSGSQLLYKPLMYFHQQYPHIKVSVSDLKTEKTVERLLSSELDLGVVFLPIYHQQIKSLFLFSSNLYVVLSKDHDLVQSEYIHLRELKNYPLFLMPEPYMIRKVINDACMKIGVRLNPIVESSDVNSLIDMALMNNGATILPDFYISDERNSKLKMVKIIDPIDEMKVGAIYKKGMYLSTVLQTFINYLKKSFNNN